MTIARNILRDLVEKKLWPIALLMVVAIVAIPVVFGGSEAGTDQTALPAAPAGSANTSSSVELLAPPSVRKRPGKVVDPFRRKPKAAETSSAAPTPVVTPSSGSAGTGSAGTPTGETGSQPPGTGKPVRRKPSLTAYRTSVRWSAGNEGTARRISRLTPLGELLNPAVMFLGIRPDGKHALFLLGPEASSVGEAGCAEESCRVISLEVGETQIVDVKTEGSAESRQYELEVASIKRVRFASAAKAAAVRAYVHPDGVDVLRLILSDEATKTAATGFGYDRSRGVIVSTGAQPAASGG